MSVHPTQEQLTIIKQKYYDKPFTMVNLLQFKGGNKKEESRRMYHEYTKQVAPIIQEINAKVIYLGVVHDVFIGDSNDMWDEVLLMYYPSGKMFLQMIAMEKYQHANTVREAALEKCVLLITEKLI